MNGGHAIACPLCFCRWFCVRSGLSAELGSERVEAALVDRAIGLDDGERDEVPFGVGEIAREDRVACGLLAEGAVEGRDGRCAVGFDAGSLEAVCLGVELGELGGIGGAVDLSDVEELEMRDRAGSFFE